MSTRADLSFVVHKLSKLSSNPRKLYFKVLVHILRCIRDNMTLELKLYAHMNDEPLSELLRQDSINIENQLIDFSDSSWQNFPDTGRSTGAYIIFYQRGPIDHGPHVPRPVAQ